MPKPYITTTTTYEVDGTVRVTAVVTGSHGEVTATFNPAEGGEPLTLTLDVFRQADRRTGAPRGWTLMDPDGGSNHLPTLSDVHAWARRWTLTAARA